MSVSLIARWECPRCGFENRDRPEPDFFRPWHIRGRDAVRAYIESLGCEAFEWLLALYVDDGLDLLAVDTIAQGDISSCPVPFGSILVRGYQLNAKGFVLVHNHPSGDPTPTDTDVQMTRRLSTFSQHCNLPLLDHFVIAGDEIRAVGYW